MLRKNLFSFKQSLSPENPEDTLNTQRDTIIKSISHLLSQKTPEGIPI